MKKSLLTFIMLLMAVVTISAKGNNKRVIFTTTPQMHCESCENKIQGSLRFVKGVKIIQIARERQMITITFDSTKCTTDKLIKEFKKIKYNAKVVDPNTIPSCCEGETTGDHSKCEEPKNK